MTYEYDLDEQDFVDYQLFIVSKSERMLKKKRNSRLLLTAGSFSIAAYFYAVGTSGMMYYFLLIGVLTALFYPKYYKWRYKNHYRNFIRTNYAARFNKPATLELTQSQVIARDDSGEGKVHLTEVEQVNETQNHFFLQLKSNDSLIIPKKKLDDFQNLKAEFKSRNLKIVDELDWKWN